MDLEKIKQKLAALKEQQTNTSGGGKGNDLIWKPSAGKNEIRLLPNLHQKDYPFVELMFYYDFGRTYLAPSTFSKPDPVIEFCEQLKSQKVDKETARENWRFARKLEPKFRTYVPILVRGQESEGVKFWGFGKQIYQEFLAIIADDDFGDITDLKSGRDVTVEYTPSTKEGTFPDTKIRVKPKTTPATTDVDVLDKIKNMPNLVQIWTEPDYDTLKEALGNYLKGGKAETNTQAKQSSPVASETNEPAPVTKSVDDVASEFEDLFNDLPF